MIEDCSKLDYIHPKLENKDVQTGFKSLDYFPKQLKELKGSVFKIEESNENYLAQKIKAMFKENGKLKNIKMTETYNSLLKNGKRIFVMNFRYLEFLRKVGDNGESVPIIVSKNGDNFIAAFGKNFKGEVPVSWTELYFFNVNGKNEGEIKAIANELELFAVALIAEKFKTLEEWKEEIVKCSKNLKKYIFPTEGDKSDITAEDLGEFGGEVYAAMLSISDRTVNFPMQEEEVKSYLKKLLANVNKAVTDPDINNDLLKKEVMQSLIKNLQSKKDEHIIYRIEYLEKELNSKCQYKVRELTEITRPFYLGDLKEGINCEAFVSLALYLLCHNLEIFHEIKSIEICFVPREILYEFSINSVNPHLFLLFEYNKSKWIFDPTGVLNNIKSDLSLKSKLIDTLEVRGYFVEFSIPELKGEKYVFDKIAKDDGLFLYESNLSSPYCIISSLKNRDKIDKSDKFVGFVVFIPDKHLDAGMPISSIMGSTIRRILVGLSSGSPHGL